MTPQPAGATTSAFLLIVWAVLLILPSTPFTRFNGVPFSSPAEAVAVSLMVPLAISAPLRRVLRCALKTRSAWIGRLFVTAIIALMLKGVLLTGRPSGFLACYQSTLTPPPARMCERSYENPFFLFSSTRIDRVLDFGHLDWNLSFFNSLRFNLFPWEPGIRRRDRLPFSVTWRGVVDCRPQQTVAVTYVGEGRIAIDTTVENLRAAYETERTLLIDVPPGRHSVRVSYTFDDGSVTGDARHLGPYATFRLRAADVDGHAPGPLPPAPGPLALRAAGAAVDVIVIGVSVALLLWYVWLLRREARAALIAAAAVAALSAAAANGVPANAGATVVVWLLFGLVLLRNRSSTLLIAYFTVLLVSAVVARQVYPALETVSYRSAGNDWLTYESFARSVLETGSFEAGERVFYVQPLFRYLRFAEHFLFGDGDPLLFVVGWTLLHWTVLWAASVLRTRRPLGCARNALFTTAGTLTLALAGSAPVVRFMEVSLSEHVTWIFLSAAFALISVRQRYRRWSIGSALLGMALITRPNQALALLATAAALLRATAKLRPRAVVAACAVFIAVCLLPLAHNLYYGGRAVFFTTTWNNPAALGVPLTTLAKILAEPTARAALFQQLRGLMFFPPLSDIVGSGTFSFVLHALQAVWIVAVWLAWRRRMTIDLRILVFVPALYLAVHVVYDIGVYYPRHILAAYFAMGLVSMAVAAARERTDL